MKKMSEETKGVVVVNGVEYKIKTAGPAQITGIARIISQVGIAAKRNLVGMEDGDNLSIIASLIGSITEEQLVELAALCIGSDKEFAKENFDLVWVTEAMAVLMEETNLSAVIKNFTRIASRFRS
jgi:hypothetical protein